VKNNGS
jgi:hypothetical protein